MPSSILPRDKTGNYTVGQSSREVGAQMLVIGHSGFRKRSMLNLEAFSHAAGCQYPIGTARDGVFDLLDSLGYCVPITATQRNATRTSYQFV